MNCLEALFGLLHCPADRALKLPSIIIHCDTPIHLGTHGIIAVAVEIFARCNLYIASLELEFAA